MTAFAVPFQSISSPYFLFGKTKLFSSIGVDMRLASGVLHAKSRQAKDRETDEAKLECLCDSRLLSSFHASSGKETHVVCHLVSQDGDCWHTIYIFSLNKSSPSLSSSVGSLLLFF